MKILEKENNESKATSGGLSAKLAEYKGEFKRIVWLAPEELRKNTVTVIGICIIFFVIIFCYDFAFSQVMTWFSRLVG